MLIPETHYRLGNLVKDFGGNIVPIIRLTAGKQPLETPIEITEELLICLGLEKENLGWYVKGQFRVKRCTYVGTSDEGDFHYWQVKRNDEFIFDFGKQPQYIHQIQNLYFAITGEELIYTP